MSKPSKNLQHHTIQTLAILVEGIDSKLDVLDGKVDKMRTDQTVAKLQVKVEVLMYVAASALGATIFQILYLLFKGLASSGGLR